MLAARRAIGCFATRRNAQSLNSISSRRLCISSTNQLWNHLSSATTVGKEKTVEDGDVKEPFLSHISSPTIENIAESSASSLWKSGIIPRTSGSPFSTSGNPLVQYTTLRRPYASMMQHTSMITFSTSVSPKPEDEKQEEPISTASSTPTDGKKESSSDFTAPASPPMEKGTGQKISEGLVSALKAITSFFFRLPGIMWFYLTNPRALRDRVKELGEAAKKEANHYWMGTKLLYADLRTARQMLGRTLKGSPLTRRERKQLLRTVSDLFRLVPMSMFVLIPFMEFALPFALRLFPNMLPSTFQDSLKAEENMKRELQSRIAMAQFFQETLGDLAKEQKKQAEKLRKKEKKELGEGDSNGEEESLAVQQQESASSMLEFLGKARKGEMIPPDVIIKFATHFHDDLTLDNMPRMQLINMCKYMSIPPYGANSFLRFQLRNRIRTLKEDDQRILWEGIDSLTKMELREACRERGMRSTGLSKGAYKNSLQQWLDLSVNQKVPISLLIMSRTFFLRDEMTGIRTADDDGSKSVAGLVDAISGLDKDVVNEVVLEVATAEEKQSDPEVMKLKLVVLEQQNELIIEEQKERDEAAKKKEEQQQEKATVADSVAAESDSQTPEQEDQSQVELPDTFVVEIPAESEAVAIQPDPESKSAEEETKTEEEKKEEREVLSSGELEAIAQLVSPDPVRSEREELKRIREAILRSNDKNDESEAETSENKGLELKVRDAVTETVISKAVQKVIAESEERVNKEAAETTHFSTDVDTLASGEEDVVDETKVEEEYSGEDKRLDKAIKRLQSKVESMVGKIEVQLSDVEVKIGDKLHFLDKDMDGMLTQEELANVLQQVLKRELTSEEAMEMAAHMDENEDGFLTVAELASWLENSKIEKLVEEGRDGEVDRIIAKQAESSKEDPNAQHEEQITQQKGSKD